MKILLLILGINSQLFDVKIVELNENRKFEKK